jgi:hypothetical protein
MTSPNKSTRLWSPARRSASPRLQAIIQQAIEETRMVGRTRQRRAVAMVVFKQSVDALLSDVLYAELEGHAGVTVRLSNSHLGRAANRYRTSIETQGLRATVKALEAGGWLSVERGFKLRFSSPRMANGRKAEGKQDRLSVLRIGSRLQAISATLERRDFKSDFTHHEVLILKATRESFWEEAPVRDYPDTVETRRMRAELIAINDWLEGLSIAAPGADISNRHLRRVFNGSFTQGGRLFGGFWQNMAKADRLNLLVSAETISVIDYRQLYPRLLYNRAGAEPPFGDLYAIPGLSAHEHAACREGVKKALNALVWSTPDRADRYPKQVRQLMPKGVTWKQAVELIRQHHHPIAHLLGQGLGPDLMFTESRLLVAVLKACMDRDMPALPLHDAIIVPVSRAHEAKAVMEGTAEKLLGVRLPVSLSGLPRSGLAGDRLGGDSGRSGLVLA